MIFLAFFRAFGPLVIMTALIYNTTIFDKIKIYTGPDEYAEKVWPFMPWYCGMPLNTIINFGYTALGFYWLLRRTHQRTDCVYSLVLVWMTIIYSVIQSCRIATQKHIFGVLDQWYTLHMASWIFNWALSLQIDNKKWSLKKTTLVDFLSCLSYPLLALIDSRGFEVTIGVHLLLICGAIIRLHFIRDKKDDPARRLNLIFIDALCCLGFVLFDLYELHLASIWSSVFTVCSGHFLSRVCDILQIHFTITLLTMIDDYEYNEHVIKIR